MPLKPGKANIGANIKEMGNAGHSRAQSVAAALSKAYGPQKRADGGHVGALRGDTPGRADKVDTTVEDGSHIIPADIVSYLGSGNTDSGFLRLEKLFPNSVAHRAWGGGLSSTGLPHLPNPAHMPGMVTPHITPLRLPRLAGVPGMRKPPVPHMAMAEGGEAAQIPVMLSHGEFACSPRDVTIAGGGDIEKGHQAIDKWILKTRKEAIAKLRSLPKPVGMK